jgi:hypothetical protein
MRNEGKPPRWTGTLPAPRHDAAVAIALQCSGAQFEPVARAVVSSRHVTPLVADLRPTVARNVQLSIRIDNWRDPGGKCAIESRPAIQLKNLARL